MVLFMSGIGKLTEKLCLNRVAEIIIQTSNFHGHILAVASFLKA